MKIRYFTKFDVARFGIVTYVDKFMCEKTHSTYFKFITNDQFELVIKNDEVCGFITDGYRKAIIAKRTDTQQTGTIEGSINMEQPTKIIMCIDGETVILESRHVEVL